MTDEGTETEIAPEDVAVESPDDVLRGVTATRDEVDGIYREAEEALKTIMSGKEVASKLPELLAAASDSADKTKAMSAAAEKSKLAIEATAADVEDLLTTAKADQAEVKALATEAVALRAQVTEDRTTLDELTTEAAKLKGKIEDLLPGATSAGLASSFMQRKEQFKWPGRGWGLLALASIAGVGALGLFGPGGMLDLSTSEATLSWETVLQAILWRIPVAAPIIWLAIYAGRHHYLTKRLEEEYGDKEVVSRAFEGFKREMRAVGATEDSPLGTLCDNMLASLARSPGRLYDRKHQDFTPANALLDAIDPKTIATLATEAGIAPEKAKEFLVDLLRHMRRG